MEFVERNDVIDLCDVALGELLLTLHVYSQGMIIPEQRSNKQRVVGVLVKPLLWPQQDSATRFGMKSEATECLDDMERLVPGIYECVRCIESVIFPVCEKGKPERHSSCGKRL